MLNPICIIGFGKFGRALADVLGRRKPPVKIYGWDIVDTGDSRQTHSPTLIAAAPIIFIAVPSEHFSEGLSILKGIPKTSILVTCTKGFDKRTGKLPIEVLRQSFTHNPLAVLSGPTLSQELRGGLPAKATIASRSPKAKSRVKDLLRGTNLSLEFSNDEIGVSLCGVLKNIYALALGLADGLGLGSNFKSCLVLRALKEMAAIIAQNGGKKETLWTSAGIADFLATGYSDKSRNYTYGFKKARQESTAGLMAEGATARRGGALFRSETTEGVKNIKPLIARIKKHSLPLLGSIQGIFLERKPPRQTLIASIHFD